jgi:hypothetical protein
MNLNLSAFWEYTKALYLAAALYETQDLEAWRLILFLGQARGSRRQPG